MNKQEILDLVAKPSMKENPPEFEIGDTVEVHTKILEGTKERIQRFYSPKRKRARRSMGRGASGLPYGQPAAGTGVFE